MARDVGHGSLKKGERVLDLFVKKVARRGTAPSEAVAAAHAMPIGSDKTQNGPVVRVDDRCGVGWYLGSDGLCRSNYYDRYYAPRYWGPYRGPVPCNGRGVHPILQCLRSVLAGLQPVR